MKLVSVSLLSDLVTKDRDTVRKAIGGMKFEDGPKGAKLYRSDEALAAIARAAAGPSRFTSDRLNLKKIEEIDLNLDIKRRERIPIEDLTEINEQVVLAVVAQIKANKGKKLTQDLINDMLANFRAIPEKLKWIS